MGGLSTNVTPRPMTYREGQMRQHYAHLFAVAQAAEHQPAIDAHETETIDPFDIARARLAGAEHEETT